MTKDVKYKVGDVLYCTVYKCNVVLLRRWDITPAQRTAWMCSPYPDGTEEFAVPEDELENI